MGRVVANPLEAKKLGRAATTAATAAAAALTAAGAAVAAEAAAARARRELELRSKAAYNSGLFVAKINHAPTGPGLSRLTALAGPRKP